jgi:molybdate transport system regulatory protein
MLDQPNIERTLETMGSDNFRKRVAALGGYDPSRSGERFAEVKSGKEISLRLKSRHWVVDDQDRIIMGEGRKEILETIEKTGSINKTAKLMKMSYKGVWSKIKVTESYLGRNIIHADRRDGSRLTAEGKALLEKYRKLKKRCLEEDNRCFSEIFGD